MPAGSAATHKQPAPQQSPRLHTLHARPGTGGVAALSADNTLHSIYDIRGDVDPSLHGFYNLIGDIAGSHSRDRDKPAESTPGDGKPMIAAGSVCRVVNVSRRCVFLSWVFL